MGPGSTGRARRADGLVAPAPGVRFENTYARELEGLYVPWRGTDFPDPRVVQLNRALAEELGLDPDFLAGADGAALLAGSRLPEDTTPLAQAYAGHQFGGFSPQLGDGRALLVGELVDGTGRRWDLHLKGSGATPFSRGGDGKAVLGPVLREYLIGESMYALGVPTTRALAVVTTGERVRRQDGPEPGAVLARIASSHLRVGTFQFFAARGEGERVRQLADYAIRRHFPGLAESGEPYLDLFRAVRDRQATLVAKWMAVGFVHGVMNTDNMTISGETIDYGPCAFVDAYDPAAVFSSIDRGGRYAYGNQPSIALWNLARFAETLLHLIDPESTKGAVEKVRGELEDFPVQHRLAWLAEMRGKLGLERADPGDADLIDALLSILTRERADFTGTFRALADVLRGDRQPLRALLADPQALDEWIEGWEARIALEGTTYPAPTDRAAAMDRVNPLYIPRNHKVEEALQAASRGLDFGPFERLLEAVTDPFRKRAGFEVYEEPAPPGFGPYTTFCGT